MSLRLGLTVEMGFWTTASAITRSGVVRPTFSQDVSSHSRRFGAARFIAVVVVVSLLASACVGPALTEESYRRKAVASLEQLHATVAGASVALEAAVDGRSFSTATAVNVRQHEETVSWVQSAFVTRQPPPGADGIRAAVVPVLADAAALMAEIRIAANRSDVQQLRRQQTDLDELSERINRVLGEVRR